MFRTLSAHHQAQHRTLLHKKIRSNIWSIVYVDLPVNICVVICYTGS
jgi:hypothetical protein